MKVLLTGFGLFHDFSANPTELLVQHFPELPNIMLKKLVFKVDFETVAQKYTTELTAFNPDLIINLGLNATANTIQLEEFALNTAVPNQTIIVEHAPTAYRSTLPLYALSKRLNQAGIPSQVSQHAGTYLCNFIYYHSLHYMQKKKGAAVFVHLPFSTELVCQFALQNQRTYPSLPMATLQKAIKLLIQDVEENQGTNMVRNASV